MFAVYCIVPDLVEHLLKRANAPEREEEEEERKDPSSAMRGTRELRPMLVIGAYS
jgi:hypothetical protein